jgi:hypothetical protein
MHGSNTKRSGVLPSIQPLVIARSDFEKLYPVYQKMALALVQTGKVLIVEDTQPSTAPMPPSGGYRNCAPSHSGGLVAQEGAEGVPFRASLDGDGGFRGTPQRDGHQPVSLGYYRLIRNGTLEKRIGVED